MKKKHYLLIIFCIFSVHVYAQDYSFYYNTCNNADRLKANGNYKVALANYEKAFNSVPHVHSYRLMNACTTAVHVNEFNKAYNFAKLSVINSGSTAIMVRLKRGKYRKFRKTKYYKNLKDSLETFKSQNALKINKEYKKKIDSLQYVDQNIIRNNKSIKGNYKIDLSSLPEDKYELDDRNFKALLQLIDQYGFPSEELLGSEGYLNASIIIHHCFRKKENEKYHYIIFDAIEKGWYLPRNFSFWYEQFYVWHKNQSFFGVLNKDNSESNLERIKANKAKFYLK